VDLLEERREIYRHYAATGRPPTPSPDALSALEAAHDGDRLDPDWNPHDRDHNQADLAAAGLHGSFWQLP
jgi:hypothetical protein